MANVSVDNEHDPVISGCWIIFNRLQKNEHIVESRYIRCLYQASFPIHHPVFVHTMQLFQPIYCSNLIIYLSRPRHRAFDKHFFIKKTDRKKKRNINTLTVYSEKKKDIKIFIYAYWYKWIYSNSAYKINMCVSPHMDFFIKRMGIFFSQSSRINNVKPDKIGYPCVRTNTRTRLYQFIYPNDRGSGPTMNIHLTPHTRVKNKREKQKTYRNCWLAGSRPQSAL